MNRFAYWLSLLWKEEQGQDVIEYALILALIALAAVSVFPPLSTAITAVFTRATTCLAPGAAGC